MMYVSIIILFNSWNVMNWKSAEKTPFFSLVASTVNNETVPPYLTERATEASEDPSSTGLQAKP